MIPAPPPEPPAFALDCRQAVGSLGATLVAVEAESGRLRALIGPARALEATPAGSVFKLVTGLAGIEAGLARDPIDCRGSLRASTPAGQTLVVRCWRPEGHGLLELEDALAGSCNVYFLELGRRTGPVRLSRAAHALGLSMPAGSNPSDPRVALGEGPGWPLSPLASAGLVAAIATGGPVFEPAWAHPRRLAPAPASRTTLARLRAGMRRAVTGGTARQAAVAGLAVAGKTGTAGYPDGSGRTWGWFLGFARGPSRTLALAVRVDDASGRGEAAALGGAVFARWKARGCP